MSYERLLDDICGIASDYDFTDYEIEHYGFHIPEGLWIKTMFERFKHTFESEKEKKEQRKLCEKEDWESILEEEGNINDYPNYDASYYEEEGFSDSFEYFKDVFWTLIELAILGAPDESDFARWELCSIMNIPTELIGQVTENDLEFEDNTDGDPADDEMTEGSSVGGIVSNKAPEEKTVTEKESLVYDITSKKPLEEMSETERDNLFMEILDRALKHLKKQNKQFTAEYLCNHRLHKNPVVFSRIRTLTKGVSRNMLINIGVALELSNIDMEILFRTRGYAFPSNLRDKMIYDGISKNLPWSTMEHLLPPDDKTKTTSSSNKTRE